MIDELRNIYHPVKWFRLISSVKDPPMIFDVDSPIPDLKFYYFRSSTGITQSFIMYLLILKKDGVGPRIVDLPTFEVDIHKLLSKEQFDSLISNCLNTQQIMKLYLI